MYKVLIVDDELLVITSLKASINWNNYGFEVIGEASNGIEAYDKILNEQPDLVFTDIRMPGMTGLELLKKVNDLNLQIQFVVISGYAEFAYAQKALNYGALGFCLKPFDDNEIISILTKAKSIFDKTKASGSKESPAIIDNNNNERANEVKNETFKAILHFVNENYREDIPIQLIAVKFSVNPSYLSQLFKKETGETFTDYITRLRICYASKMLKDTSLPISEISVKSGYNDYFYFTRVFKKAKGMTPSRYRETI